MIHHLRNLLLLTLAVLPCSILHAAVSVPQTHTPLKAQGELYYFLDKSHSQTLDSIRGEATPWQRIDNQTKLPSSTTTPAWFYFSIEPSQDTHSLILYIPTLQAELEAFIFNDGELQANYDFGPSQPLSARPYPNRYYLIPIEVTRNASVEVYIRAVEHPDGLIDFIGLWQKKALMQALAFDTNFELVNIGIMLLVATVSLLAWAAMRTSVIGWFAIFAFVQFASYLIVRAYAFEWFWPEWPIIEKYAPAVMVSLSMVCLIGFSSAFLNLAQNAPRTYRVLLILNWGYIVSIIPAFLWPITTEVLITTTILPLLPGLLGISIFLYLSSRERFTSLAYFICQAPYSVMVFFLIVESFRGHSYTHLIQALEIGQILRLLLFSAWLAYIIRSAVRNEERIKADARAKTQFLTHMSHEIRTPLNGVLGMSEILRDSGLNKTQAKYNDIVLDSATSLLSIINDILDLSKIQAGKMPVERLDFNIHRLAADTMLLVRRHAQEKSIALFCDIDPNLNPWIKSDPTRIRQILINFLSNAIKFTETGEILVTLQRRQDKLYLAVTDTGVGISEEALARVFDPFTQADTSTTRRYGGTGLGLSITKQLAELIGGTAGAESNIGEGSTFWVLLPLNESPEPINTLPNHLLAGKSIVYMDTDPRYCDLMAVSAKQWQANIYIANTDEAIEHFMNRPVNGQPPIDLIAIDSRLYRSHKDNIEQRLTNLPEDNAPPCLIISNELSTQNPASIPATSYVDKPFIAADFYELFAQILQLDTREATPQPETPTTQSTPMRVLAVEDNSVNQIVLSSMLSKLGHSCIMIGDGAEAVNTYLQSHDDFDVILMDCELPGIDGYEATRQIRQHEKANQLPRKPIISLSAHAFEEHIEKSLEVGMDKHLSKPIQIKALANILEELSN